MKNLIAIIITVSFANCSDSPNTTPINNNYNFSCNIDELTDYYEKAREYGNINEYDLALMETGHIGCPPKDWHVNFLEDFNSEYFPVAAKEFILNKAKFESVIIMNYAEHLPFTHTFTTSLLDELFAQGYRTFGVEGIIKDIQLSNCGIEGYSLKNNNPQFANLLRKAHMLGMEIFPIDNLNLIKDDYNLKSSLETIGQKIPNNKMLIYSSHINSIESKLSTSGFSLAGRIKNDLQIDPLTINQIGYAERNDPMLEYFLYESIQMDYPTVFVDSDFSPFLNQKTSNWHDITIFQPRTQYNHNRPTWIADDNSNYVKVDLTKTPLSKPYLILAYGEDETNFSKVIPYDIVEAKDETDEVYLMLPNGKFQILIQNDINESKIIEIEVSNQDTIPKLKGNLQQPTNQILLASR